MVNRRWQAGPAVFVNPPHGFDSSLSFISLGL